MAAIMKAWGEQGRPRWPTPEDLQSTIDIGKQAKIGLQQAPFKVSESAQHTGAWLSEFFAQTATGPILRILGAGTVSSPTTKDQAILERDFRSFPRDRTDPRCIR